MAGLESWHELPHRPDAAMILAAFILLATAAAATTEMMEL